MKDLDESRSSSTSSLINVPATVGKYRLLDEVGHGAMGTVFRAHDPALDRIVAVKMIACPTADGSLSERFQREARLAASLNHPNIVTVYDFGQAECGFYMVMELLEGADLATALRRDQLRTLEDRLQTIEQIAEGVAFAHQRGLIHRDLKPANIHRDPQGRVKILDFGLARSSEPALTTVGAVFGTPRYMAPEQVKGEPFDMRSDVFSLGAILYEILGGEPCFPAASVHAAIFQVLERQPPSLVELDPTVPPLLARIVEKALAKQPKRRFPDAVALRLALVELRRVLQGESSESHAFSALAFSRRPAAPGKLASGAGGPDVAGSTDGSANAVAQASAAGPLHLTFMGEPGGERQLIVGHPHQESLLDVSLKASIPHFHECGGRGRCSTCRVRVIAGAQGLTPRNRVETQLAQRLGWGDDIRLACQAKPVGDIAVKRLIRDTDDFGLLRFEQDQKPPEEHALAVLTCTLSQFSAFARRAAPYDVVHILNRYYHQIGEPVLSGGGRIESTGDEVLVASFGHDGGRARDHCLAAVRVALRMLARLEDLNRYARSHFQTELHVGIGLSFGRVIVGQVGYPSRRRSTLIGLAPRQSEWLSGAAQDGLGPNGQPGPALAGTRTAPDDNVPAGIILAAENLVDIIEDDLDVGEVLSECGPAGSDLMGYEIRDFVKPDAVLVAQSTFESLARRPQEVAELFYRLLFQLDPAIEPLFEGVDMEVQGKMLMDVLALVVRGLDRLDELRPEVEDLGRRHAGYGVQLKHYDAVEQALLETMRQLLGSAFTLDVRLAWSRVYNELASIMIEAMESTTVPIATAAGAAAPAGQCPFGSDLSG